MKKILSTLILLFFVGCSSNSDDTDLYLKVQTDSNFTETNETNHNSDIENNDTIPKDDDEVKNDVDTDIGGGNEQFETDENMRIGKIYKVVKGDTLFEIDNARVRIVKNSEKSFSEIVLLSGKAKIIRNKN